MHSSFSLLCAAKLHAGSFPTTIPFNSAGLITMRMSSQYANTLCLFPLPQTKTSLGLLRKATHLQTQGHRGKSRRIMSEHTYSPAEGQSHGDTVTPAAMCMSIEKHTEVCMHTHM